MVSVYLRSKASLAAAGVGAQPNPVGERVSKQIPAALRAGYPVPVDGIAWRPFLELFSRELLACREIRDEASVDLVRSGWMGEPAGPEQIDELEGRIGEHLPDSYREFLETTNGWRDTGPFVRELWSATDVRSFRSDNQDWIDAYVDAHAGLPPLPLEEHLIYGDEQDSARFRVEFLHACLQISRRYRSFWDLMHDAFDTCKRLRQTS